MAPKNSHDQTMFRIICNENIFITKSTLYLLNIPLLSQTRYKATPIKTNNNVQTGPKIQPGGLKTGFIKPLYQVSRLVILAIEPRNPANWGIIKDIANFL